MSLRIVAIISTSLIFSGCYFIAGKFPRPDKKIELYKSSTAKSDYFVIYKITHAYCGCTSIKAEKYTNRNLTYSVSYSCPTELLPYRQVFEYDNANKVLSKTCYRATDTDDYDIPLTNEDRRMITLLDSLALTDKEVNPGHKLCIKSVKGYYRIECMY